MVFAEGRWIILLWVVVFQPSAAESVGMRGEGKRVGEMTNDEQKPLARDMEQRCFPFLRALYYPLRINRQGAVLFIPRRW